MEEFIVNHNNHQLSTQALLIPPSLQNYWLSQEVEACYLDVQNCNNKHQINLRSHNLHSTYHDGSQSEKEAVKYIRDCIPSNKDLIGWIC
mgnify:CR=1 FL=1